MDDIKKTSTPPAPRPFVLSSSVPVSFSEKVTPSPKKSGILPRRRRGWPLFLSSVAGLLLLFLLAVGGFILFQGISLGESMQFERENTFSFTSSLQHLTQAFFGEKSELLQGESEGRINILLLGRAGERYPGKNLTDTVMIMSIATKTKQVALLSLPRDLYVPIEGTGFSSKLNSLYQYGLSNDEGVEPLRETIAAITGQPIHYFATLDFDGFEKIIDTLGGISVEVSRDIYDTRYPGKNYSYETFELKKGWQTLDGKTALKYVRERHDDPEGDFGRAKRQQQVIQAVKTKAFSLGTLFNIVTIKRLVETLGESIKTDMSLEDMARLLELSRTLDTKNVTTIVIDAWKKESLLRVSHVQVGPIAAFILVPRTGNFSEIQEVSETIFSREASRERRQRIRAEAPTLTLLYLPKDKEAAARLSHYLTDELGFTSAVLSPVSSLDNRPERSMITRRADTEKPYSFDELLKRLELTKTDRLPGTEAQNKNDFTLLFGNDLLEVFSLQETSDELLPEDASFSEPLPPQPKKKR